MSPVFIFAEQVRRVAKSGKSEIEIPEGARISASAADLIKEHKLAIRTVAPGQESADQTSQADNPPAAPPPAVTDGTAKREDRVQPPAQEIPAPGPVENPPDLSEDELEEIVNRVVARVRQLKGEGPANAVADKTDAAAGQEGGAADADDLVICRCEEITRSEIKSAIRNGMHTLNGVKRVTRAGMGLCQGQTCQQLVARILTEELGLSAADIDPTTARGPVRPLPLGVFANS